MVGSEGAGIEGADLTFWEVVMWAEFKGPGVLGGIWGNYSARVRDDCLTFLKFPKHGLRITCMPGVARI